jgi:hypothetical protein
LGVPEKGKIHEVSHKEITIITASALAGFQCNVLARENISNRKRFRENIKQPGTDLLIGEWWTPLSPVPKGTQLGCPRKETKHSWMVFTSYFFGILQIQATTNPSKGQASFKPSLIFKFYFLQGGLVLLVVILLSYVISIFVFQPLIFSTWISKKVLISMKKTPATYAMIHLVTSPMAPRTTVLHLWTLQYITLPIPRKCLGFMKLYIQPLYAQCE